MKYGIGLDCGINSVGYSVMELGIDDEPRKIDMLSSRIFTAAENAKDGSSLAAPRRDSRGLRRTTRRHNHRIFRIKHLLIQNNIVTPEEIGVDGKTGTIFKGQISDIYELRTKALDRPVNNIEFARILIHLAQRRGFKSNRKADEKKDKEAGKLLTAIEDNKKRIENNNYRTVGEMLYKDPEYSDHKRNKGEAYKNTVSRAMIEKEMKMIFSAQRDFGMPFATKEIEEKYLDIALSQRPFDLGPGRGPENCRSPYYSENLIGDRMGKCVFYPEETRASKATYSFQYFTLLQNINSIKLTDEFGNKRFLTADERKEIKNLCFKKATMNYASIRKALSLPESIKFNTVSYGDKDPAEVEKKTKFEYLKPYHQIKKALGDAISTLSTDELDEIGRILTVYKNDEKIIEALGKANIDKSLYEPLLTLPSFSKTGHLSVKALKKIIPFLENGDIYSDACKNAGFDHKGHLGEKTMFLPAKDPRLDDITNPVVRRAVSQTIKVVNTIIRQMGCSPTYINIELARELSKSFNERNEIKKQNQANEERNNKIIEEIQENFHIKPNGQDIVKLKLWHEQNGIDPYSIKNIEYSRLFETGYVDIDHIIPYSISFDDSYSNKILTFAKENRQKGNRIPMDYLSDDKNGPYQVWVNSNIKGYKKRQNLLKQKLTKEDTDGFKERNLNDTKYLSKFLYNYINDSLLFEDYSTDKKLHVMSVNGAVTAYMRKRWGIKKIREDGDLHHAVDATVIACVTRGMVKQISNYANRRETIYDDVDLSTGELKADRFPMPYPTFRKELECRATIDDKNRLKEELIKLPNYTYDDAERAKPCFVSRMQNHKATGSIHEQTIRSGKVEGYTISKVPLTKLKLEKDKSGIQNYYNPKDDALLYNALYKRLLEFGGNAEKAFADGFHKPKSDGTPGPIVKKVKIIEKSTNTLPVRNGGVANNDNGSMIRIDVFYVEGDGYYFVPIYVKDTIKAELPMFACTRDKKGWKKMDDRDFIFSLYPNDLIKIKSKKGITLSVSQKDSTLQPKIVKNNVFMYFKSADISTASIKCILNDNSYYCKGLGIKSLLSIEKYVVDPIGNIHKVKKEKRMGFK